jgi:16S rRNA (adenine1518-N6/adenine1519-N6)-dimethyltransferase
MDLLNQTKELCKIYNIHPARSKGQNFLIKEEIYDKIVAAADLKKDDTVLEVGPGLGFLTAKLAEKAGRVVAVELDDKLAELLKIATNTQGVKNIEIINKNILELGIMNNELWNKDLKNKIHNSLFIIHDSYKIVANIPYNISSLLLRKFLSAEHKPSLMVLMLQKEVAERICAKPRTFGAESFQCHDTTAPKVRGKAGEMSLLAVSVQFYSRPEIIQTVSKNNFWPEPKVDSAIIRLTPHTPLIKGAPEKEFFRLVKIGFSAKRKMLKNNLANGLHITNEEAEKKLKKAGFNEKIRAQELSVEDWIKLFGEFEENMV